MSTITSLRPVRKGRGRSLVLLAAALCSPLCAQILDWEAAIAEVGSSQTGNNSDSTFTAVHVDPPDGSGQAAVALLAGNFHGPFEVEAPPPPPPPPPPLVNPNGQDGVVVRMEQNTANPSVWTPAWYLQVASSFGQVTITDLAVNEDGKFYITGRFSDDAVFQPNGPSFTTPGATTGFFAWGDAQLGIWENVIETNGMEAESIALGPGPDPEVYLTGAGSLARKFDPMGVPEWNMPAPPGTSALTDIALSPAPGAPALFVLTENTNLPAGVVLHRLDRANGDSPDNWQRRMGGTGNDIAGGLAVPVDGHARVAFLTQDPEPFFGGRPIFDPPLDVNGDLSLMLRVDPAGNLRWATPLGIPQDNGDAMTPVDVAVDSFGNAFAAAKFQGAFRIESPTLIIGNNDAAILGVDAAGVLFDFHRSSGGAVETPRAVSAPVRDFLVTVGGYEGQGSAFGSFTLPTPDPPGERGFFAVDAPIPNQQRVVLTPAPGGPNTVAEITNQIHDLGAQAYNEIRSSEGPRAMSAFIRNEDRPELEDDQGILVEDDYFLRTSGTNSDAGWALEHLNDATNTSSSPFSFGFPEPGYPVYVYLIDTAVDNSSLYFNRNTNLTLEPTTLVRGVGDPLVSSVFQHGTEMLSLLAGPGTVADPTSPDGGIGAAVGTPIILKNFDFYPTGGSSTASLLASAVYEAIDYHDANGDCYPGLIVIASSSVSVASSITLSDAIDEAVDEGIPVIIAAGNSSDDASKYVPASKGSVDGVLCVGASKADRTRLPASNFGKPSLNDPPVDLFAPGDGVRVIDYLALPVLGHKAFTGTSASAAYTGAVAATYLSVNPWSSPADLETALTGDTYPEGSSGLDILQLDASGPAFYLDYYDWTAWFGLASPAYTADDDGDGWTNIWEYFHGLKPTKFEPKGAQTDISYDNVSGQYTFSFNVSSVLLDPSSLGTLLDGTTYVAKDSTNLTSFTATGNTLTVGSSTDGQTTLSETASASPAWFFRVELTPFLPSP